jgi:hypothetical protein
MPPKAQSDNGAGSNGHGGRRSNKGKNSAGNAHSRFYGMPLPGVRTEDLSGSHGWIGPLDADFAADGMAGRRGIRGRNDGFAPLVPGGRGH